MEASPDNLETRIAQQLPVVGRQRDSLAVVMLTRWMRLMAAHGSARLELLHRHGQEAWVLWWHDSSHRTHRLEASTLAELFVRLLDERTEVKQQLWRGRPS
jgi:hypothetical protein